MGPGRLEEQMRDRLEQRSIQPSADAWERLEARLGKKRTRSLNQRGLWLAIAAVFAGAAVLLTVFGDAVSGEETPLVEVNPQTSEEVLQESNTPDTGQPSARESVVAMETEEEDKDLVPKESGVALEQSPTLSRDKDRGIPSGSRKNEEVALAERGVPEDRPTIVKEPSGQVSPDAALSPVAEDAVALVPQESIPGEAAISNEVDRLLQRAQTDLQLERKPDGVAAKVDPSSLLLEVEIDLERNFREKVFEALGKGFEKIRTAVAERNN